ncbi:MAG TPA: hypothetical protein DGC94_23370 [Prolixibacteraceae bacterium]|nr:hypothetical protein [Prolixibacteraceae bacterium]
MGLPFWKITFKVYSTVCFSYKTNPFSQVYSLRNFFGISKTGKSEEKVGIMICFRAVRGFRAFSPPIG